MEVSTMGATRSVAIPVPGRTILNTTGKIPIPSNGRYVASDEKVYYFSNIPKVFLAQVIGYEWSAWKRYRHHDSAETLVIAIKQMWDIGYVYWPAVSGPAKVYPRQNWVQDAARDEFARALAKNENAIEAVQLLLTVNIRMRTGDAKSLEALEFMLK